MPTATPPRSRLSTILPLIALLAACAATVPIPPERVLIFGEQHDQPDHQRQVADTVRRLAGEHRLAAVVIEMAERGRSTSGLGAGADEAQVRDALAWANWEWPVYAQVVMNAVRAGVPVLGGNLPREAMGGSMADATLDARVPAPAREAIAQAVRDGHCGLLPQAQEPGMVRIQIARDRSIAQTVAEAVRSAAPDQRVVLLTGAQHASRDRGVPLHLADAGLLADETVRVTIFGRDDFGLKADEQRAARVTPRPDPCEGLQQQLDRRRNRAASSPG